MQIAHPQTRKDTLFGFPTLVLIVVGIAINYTGARLALYFEIPLFLDCIGTVLSAALGGYLPGIIVGFFSNVLGSTADPITLYYSFPSVLIAIAAAYLSSHGAFRRLWSMLLSALLFSLIGGGIGSLLTWLLYGFDFGTGISAPYAYAINANTGFGKFTSQFIADMGIDLADKAITVAIAFIVLHVLPDRLLRNLPLGHVYARTVRAPNALATQALADSYRRYSLRNKVAGIIVIAALVLSSSAIAISYVIYKDNMTQHYERNGTYVLDLAEKIIDEDSIDVWLAATGTVSDGSVVGLAAPGNEELMTAYTRESAELAEVLESFSDIAYLYVYQIREDGCHVVFDIDTASLEGEPLGTLIDFDSEFEGEIDALLAGEEIEPISANGQYGWLLSIYRPLFDSRGTCVAYAAVDYDMYQVVSDRYVFIIRIAALLFGASIVIVALALLYADRRMVRPVNALTAATEGFAYNDAEGRKKSSDRIQKLDITTGDEIENLYGAITRMTEEVSDYITEVDEQAAKIVKMQDNIILSFASMVESRDENTGGHIRRTAEYVRIVGTVLLEQGKYPDVLTQDYLHSMVKSAPLHDIGKVKVPDAILNKPGKLTPDEFKIIQAHTTEGARILEGIFVGIEGKSQLSEAIDMALSHHERWDGKGYPQGLAGEEIPLCARVMAIADVFDALVSRRSYKEPFAFDEAIMIIEGASETVFDPVVASAFLSARESIREQLEHDATIG